MSKTESPVRGKHPLLGGFLRPQQVAGWGLTAYRPAPEKPGRPFERVVTQQHLHEALRHPRGAGKCIMNLATGGTCGHDVVEISGKTYRMSEPARRITKLYDRLQLAADLNTRAVYLQELQALLPARIQLTFLC